MRGVITAFPREPKRDARIILDVPRRGENASGHLIRFHQCRRRRATLLETYRAVGFLFAVRDPSQWCLARILLGCTLAYLTDIASRFKG